MLGGALLDAGEAERALRLVGAAAALREEIASPPSAADRNTVEETLRAARATLGAQTASEAYEGGRATPLARVLSEALAEPPEG